MWGKLDHASGNNKPKYANVSTTMGVSVTETPNAYAKVAHAGWVKVNQGTGYIQSITITGAGTGINANGYLSISTSGAGYTNANASFVVSSNANPALNTVVSVTVLNPGSGYPTTPTVTYVGSNTTRPTFSVTMGGRANRNTTEVLVASASITGDDTADNTFFPGT
jgi:hypothetical protein